MIGFELVIPNFGQIFGKIGNLLTAYMQFLQLTLAK